MDPPNHNDDLKIPEHPEQDQDGGDDLPTYDDLTVQQPNSRHACDGYMYEVSLT
jgi:hypothetical protein